MTLYHKKRRHTKVTKLTGDSPQKKEMHKIIRIKIMQKLYDKITERSPTEMVNIRDIVSKSFILISVVYNKKFLVIIRDIV